MVLVMAKPRISGPGSRPAGLPEADKIGGVISPGKSISRRNKRDMVPSLHKI